MVRTSVSCGSRLEWQVLRGALDPQCQQDGCLQTRRTVQTIQFFQSVTSRQKLLDTPQQYLEKLLLDWRQQGSPSVWSIVITVFGDAIVPRGGVISLASLLAIFERLGIEPNALRTALSRLARDGWITRIKHGRQSSYMLAPDGTELFASAAQRIYAGETPEWSNSLEFKLLPVDAQTDHDAVSEQFVEMGYGSPMPGIFMRAVTGACNASPQDQASSITFHTSDIGVEDARRLSGMAWPLEELSHQYAAFSNRYRNLHAALQAGDLNEPLDCLAVRTIVIHDWRRIVLKDPNLPADLTPEPWPGNEAGHIVAGIYRNVLEKSEAYLDDCYLSPENLLPKPGKELRSRFE